MAQDTEDINANSVDNDFVKMKNLNFLNFFTLFFYFVFGYFQIIFFYRFLHVFDFFAIAYFLTMFVGSKLQNWPLFCVDFKLFVSLFTCMRVCENVGLKTPMFCRFRFLLLGSLQ